MAQSFKDLVVWQRAIRLAESIYTLCGRLPTDERFGLSSQMKRAAVSVPSNIAEGYMRTTREYLQFINIARGSLAELETQLILVERLYYKESEEEHAFKERHEVEQVARMLSALRTSITKKLSRPNP